MSLRPTKQTTSLRPSLRPTKPEEPTREQPSAIQRALTGLMGTVTDPFVKEQEARIAAAGQTLRETGNVSELGRFVAPGAPEVQPQLERQERQFREAIATPAGKVGQVAGEIGKFALPYTAGGGAVEKIVSPISQRVGQAVTGKLGQALTERAGQVAGRAIAPAVGKAAEVITTEFAKDVIIGKPINYVQGRQQGLEGKELAEFMGEQAIIDLVANTAFYGLGKGIQALKKTTPEIIEQASEEVAKQTTMPKEVIAEVIEKQAPEVKVTPEIEPKVTPRAELIDVNQPDATQKIRSFTKTSLESPASGEELKMIIKDNPQYYDVLPNKQAIEVSEGIVKDSPEAAKNMILSGDKFDNVLEPEIGRQLVKSLQDQGKYEEAFNIIEKLGQKGTKAGQEIQLFKLWKTNTPEGMSKWAEKTLRNSDVKVDADMMKGIVDDMNFIQSATAEELKEKILGTTTGIRKNVLDRLIDVNDMERLKDLNIALVMKNVTDKIPISTARKLSSFQAISHLLNAKTMIRNTLGNLTFSLGETLSKVLGVPMDRLISLKTGKHTVAIPNYQKSFRNALEQGKESVEEVLLGVEIMDKNKYNLFRGKTFKAPVLTQMEDALSLGLKAPDEFFKGYTKADSLYSQLKARGVQGLDDMNIEQMMDIATKQELQQAEQEALFATFQDNSLPAQMFQGLKDIANKLGVGQKVRGPSGINTREFGAGDLLIKYTRVPGNLISRGVEYSPLGYAKALKMMTDLNKSGQRNLALQLGRATTGSGLIALGAWLRNKGLITGSSTEQSLDEAAFDRAQGLGNYQLNVDAMERLVRGEDPTAQLGDTLESYSWNQPLNTTFAIGSMLADRTPEMTAGDITSKTMEEMLDIPTLSTIQSMFYEAMSDEPAKGFRILSVPFVQGASGFVPAPIRQTAQYLDPVYRTTTREGIVQPAVERVQSALPGVRQQLEPQITSTGEVREGEPSIYSTFISPGTRTTYEPVDYAQSLQIISDITGDKTIYPTRKAPKNITFAKQKFELSDQEKTTYQQVFGQTLDNAYNNLFSRFDVNALNQQQIESLVPLLNKIETQAREMAKQRILIDRAR